MKLESSYIRTSALGAVRCFGAPPDQFQWKQGKCVNMLTGAVFQGDQTKSNCQCLHGPAPVEKGLKASFDFLANAFGITTAPTRGGALPQPTHTASSLLLPAVAVVGGVALLLILKKKK